MDKDYNTEIQLVLVRHVPTKLNAEKISRSWLKVGPDPEKLESMGPGIAEALEKLGVAKLRSSDLPRARKTADWLGERLGIPVASTYDMRTWNTGEDVSGKKEAETIPIRKKYIKNAEIAPRGGEAFQDFIDRNIGQFKNAAQYNAKNPDEPMALVVHGHHLMAAEEMFTGEDVDPDELDDLDEEFPPGSVMLLHIRGNEAEIERIHPKGEKEFDEEVSQ
jgi:broad specificity phosphatase PhoE